MLGHRVRGPPPSVLPGADAAPPIPGGRCHTVGRAVSSPWKTAVERVQCSFLTERNSQVCLFMSLQLSFCSVTRRDVLLLWAGREDCPIFLFRPGRCHCLIPSPGAHAPAASPGHPGRLWECWGKFTVRLQPTCHAQNEVEHAPAPRPRHPRRCLRAPPHSKRLSKVPSFRWCSGESDDTVLGFHPTRQ